MRLPPRRWSQRHTLICQSLWKLNGLNFIATRLVVELKTEESMIDMKQRNMDGKMALIGPLSVYQSRFLPQTKCAPTLTQTAPSAPPQRPQPWQCLMSKRHLRRGQSPMFWIPAQTTMATFPASLA